jgi:hypothetical protein
MKDLTCGILNVEHIWHEKGCQGRSKSRTWKEHREDTMRKNLVVLLGVVAVCLSVVTAQAIVVDYQIGPASSVDAFVESPGDWALDIETLILPSLDGYAFDLDDGESETFDFFDIWTDESDVANGEDTVPRSITASLDFVLPSGAGSVDVEGDTYGVTWYGIFEHGEVAWDGPSTVDLGWLVFEVSLNDAEFNNGLFGLHGGECSGATIEATVRQIRSSNGGGGQNVPDGGMTLGLLGMALAGLGMVRRRIG